MSSAAGVVKDVVDELRDEGVKAGMLRVRFFRPFPAEEFKRLARGKKGVAVLRPQREHRRHRPARRGDKERTLRPRGARAVQEYIFGLGGRDFFAADARAVFERMMKNDYRAGARFIGLLERGGEDVRD